MDTPMTAEKNEAPDVTMDGSECPMAMLMEPRLPAPA